MSDELERGDVEQESAGNGDHNDPGVRGRPPFRSNANGHEDKKDASAPQQKVYAACKSVAARLWHHFPKSEKVWTAGATVVMAGAMIAYTTYTQRQWETLNGQLVQMIGTSGQTERLVILNAGQLRKLAEQAKATGDLATAAQGQAEAMRNVVSASIAQRRESEKQTAIAAQQLEASTRAWMAAEVAITGPITFDSRGAQIEFTVRSTNLGHSPALSVDIRAKVLNRQSLDVVSEQKELCPPGKGDAIRVPWGETVFPGQESIRRFVRILDKGEMDRSRSFQGFGEEDLLPHVVACIDYVVGLSGEHHQTYMGGSVVARESGETVRIVRGKDVPLDRLVYYRQIWIGIPSN
jgi:hypothetical protein